MESDSLVCLYVHYRVATFLENLENTWNFKMPLENLENEAKILENFGNLILIRKNI